MPEPIKEGGLLELGFVWFINSGGWEEQVRGRYERCANRGMLFVSNMLQNLLFVCIIRGRSTRVSATAARTSEIARYVSLTLELMNQFGLIRIHFL